MLVCRIFEQAIDDYRELRRKNIRSNKSDDTYYSIKDIEAFFGGDWCYKLLELTGVRFSGEDILKSIRRLCTKEQIA